MIRGTQDVIFVAQFAMLWLSAPTVPNWFSEQKEKDEGKDSKS